MQKPPRPYAAFKADIAKITELSGPRLILLWGPSAYFLLKGYKHLRSLWRHEESLLVKQSGDPLSDEEFIRLFAERGLFHTENLSIVLGVEKQKDFYKKLSLIPAIKSLNGPLVLSLTTDTLSAPWRKEVERLKQVQTIACFAPAAFEYLHLIEDLWRALARASLTQAAKALLLEQVGNDAFKLENELNKLSAIFADHKGEVDASDIAPHLGLLREEQVFILDELLGAGNFAKAQAMLLDLLSRGEAPIALLGILARHVRNACLVASGHGTKLPVFLAKHFQRYSRASTRQLQACLALCQETDLDLKGGGVALSEDLLLSRIISELSLA